MTKCFSRTKSFSVTKSFSRPIAAVLLLAPLFGCNSARQQQAVAPQSAVHSVTSLPDGAGCSGAVARYRAIMDNDLAMGHVNQGVYTTIQNEIGEAAAACAAGQDARASSLVHASKARHGYPG
jgi:hypothetical protein